MTSQARSITPHLWFDTEANAAAEHYVSVFNDGDIGAVSHYDAATANAAGQPEGSVLTVPFEIEGQPFIALNGGPQFAFNPSISFIVNCPTTDGVDELWSRLSAGGEELMPLDSYPFSDRYGWTTDTYGVSWQLRYRDDSHERAIVPSLLFVGERCGQAKAAIDVYTAVFDDSDVGEIARYGPDQDPEEEVTVKFAEFTVAGQPFAAMDSAHEHDFDFNESISFVVACEDQDAIDHVWERLTADGGQPGRCGWLTDRFGVSWQVVPTVLSELLRGDNAEHVTEALLHMDKLDIAGLEAAHDG